EAPERDPGVSAAPPRARVLVVDDEPAMLRALRINLRVRKYDVATAATGGEGLAEAGRRPPGAVIPHLGLPDRNGIEVLRRLRGWSGAPVIVLSGRAGPGEKIAALDAGADDYVTKPFSMGELLARLRAALRRDAAALPVRVRIGTCEIDLAAHTVVEGSKAVRLTPTQWRLLEILLRHPGQLVATQRLLTEIWGPGYERYTNYLRVHMSGLRRTLETHPSRPRPLLPRRGM